LPIRFAIDLTSTTSTTFPTATNSSTGAQTKTSNPKLLYGDS
jgi:hypothetical protein